MVRSLPNTAISPWTASQMLTHDALPALRGGGAAETAQLRARHAQATHVTMEAGAVV